MTLRRLFLVSTVSLLALAGLGFAACGGDDDGGSSGGGGTGSDQSYVNAICKAQNTLLKSLDKAADSNPNVTDEAAALKLLEKPIDDWLKAMKAAKPPSDMKAYHDGIVKTADEAFSRLKKDKDISALGSLESQGDPPEAAKTRLAPLLAANADCKEADFSF